MTQTHDDSAHSTQQTLDHSANGAATATDKPQPPQKPHRRIPKPVRILGTIALIAGLGIGAYRLFLYEPPPDGLFLSGRIEGYETDVSAKIGGRIANMAVQEGDVVQLGQLLAQINDAELQAQLEGAKARVRAAQEEFKKAQQELPVLAAQLQQARLTTQQSDQESQGRVLEAENDVAEAHANLVEAQADLQLAQINQQRSTALYVEGAVPAQDVDDDNAALGVAQARVEAAQQQVRSAQGRLTQAQSTQKNPPIRAAEELAIQRQIAQAQTDIAVAQQDVQDAQAAQAEIEANLSYLVVNSPMHGDVITRSAEPGEVIAAGEPLLTLVNQDRLYLRGFVPEGQIGQVKVGQQALVSLDSFPDQPLEATVSRIDPKASFTPENTYFQSDRVTQVFGVELTLNNADGLAKQGMPADGRIVVSETAQTSPSTPLITLQEWLQP